MTTERDSHFGALEGTLHQDTNPFYLRPKVGHERVTCELPTALTRQAMSLVNRNISVDGELFYHADDSYPYKVRIENMDRLGSADIHAY